MATIKQGILSGFSGAIGNVTGAKVKGQDTIRTRVTKPKNPQTEAQQKARSNMAFIHENYNNLIIEDYSGFTPAFEKSEELRAKLLSKFLKILSGPPWTMQPFNLAPQSIKGDVFSISKYEDGINRVVQFYAPLEHKAFNYNDQDAIMTFQIYPTTGDCYVFISEPGAILRTGELISERPTYDFTTNEIFIYTFQYITPNPKKYYEGFAMWGSYNNFIP